MNYYKNKESAERSGESNGNSRCRDGMEWDRLAWEGRGWDDKGPRQGVAAPTGGAAHKLNRMPKGATSRGTNTHTHTRTHTRTLRVIVIEKADTGTRPIRQKYARLHRNIHLFVCVCVCVQHIYMCVYSA